ncbi:MAG: exodeoxyribonuclease VII small subunit [Candidatus Obscuribacterales bacterium]|nr:exodeoxyribonuclease VII small subunit [Candidatus Obscuribacterales bacterium]
MNEKTKSDESVIRTDTMQLSLLPVSPERTNTMTQDQISSPSTAQVPVTSVAQTPSDSATPKTAALAPTRNASVPSAALSQSLQPSAEASASSTAISTPAADLTGTVQASHPANPQSKEEDKGKDFEAALSELEKIVSSLEGEVKLEEALKLFDRGMNLSQHCQECLEEAEQRIEILKRAINGNLVSEKFNEDSIASV